MTIQQIKAAAEIAKTRTSDRRWLSAIDKAVAGVVSGWWIVTELANCLAITTESGKTYFANGVCQCRAYELGQPCKHRALYRLYAIADESDKPMAAGATSVSSLRAPRITRSVERDHTGARCMAVYCNGWSI